MKTSYMPDVKKNLIELIRKCEDENFLQEIYEMVNEHETTEDWWNSLSPEQVSRIEEAMEQYKAGNNTKHQDLKSELKAWRKR